MKGSLGFHNLIYLINIRTHILVKYRFWLEVYFNLRNTNFLTRKKLMFNANTAFSTIFEHRRNLKKRMNLPVSKSDIKTEFVEEKFLRESKLEDRFTEAPSNVFAYYAYYVIF